jgi:hypothetical protein
LNIRRAFRARRYLGTTPRLLELRSRRGRPVIWRKDRQSFFRIFINQYQLPHLILSSEQSAFVALYRMVFLGFDPVQFGK